jgi:hypothetical protein
VKPPMTGGTDGPEKDSGPQEQRQERT